MQIDETKSYEEVVGLYDYHIKNMAHICTLMENSGHKDDAKNNIIPQLNELTRKRDIYVKNAQEKRDRHVLTLMKCFCGCDLLTNLADEMVDTIENMSEQVVKEKKILSNECKTLAKRFNEVVQIIDALKDQELSFYYADMADEACEKAEDALTKTIQKYMNTKKGKDLL